MIWRFFITCVSFLRLTCRLFPVVSFYELHFFRKWCHKVEPVVISATGAVFVSVWCIDMYLCQTTNNNIGHKQKSVPHLLAFNSIVSNKPPKHSLSLSVVSGESAVYTAIVTNTAYSRFMSAVSDD